MEDNDINTRLLLVKAREDENEVKWQRKVFDETKKLCVVAGPAILCRFSTYGILVISQGFIGHIGATELAAYSLVQIVLLRFALGILWGMSSGLETLCRQAYGAKQYYMLGIYVQRSWVVLTIFTMILLPVFVFSTPLLKLLGQDDDVARVAGYISLWFIPVIFAFVVSFTCQMYLQSQSKNKIISYFAVFSLIVHVFLSWLLTVKYKWGLSGAMSSAVLAFWIPNVGQLVYIFGGWCPNTWEGFSWHAFKDLWLVIKLSVSSGVMLCLELWYNSILVLLTGNMMNASIQIDALSICLNINAWELMIAFGFMAAVGVRVANELGRGSSRATNFSIVMTVLTSLSIGLVFFIVSLLLRGRIAYIFTSSTEVSKALDGLSLLLSISILLNSIQPVLSGVAIGAGWQGKVAYVNIACYYLIGIPLGVVLGYVIKLQVVGIWLGMLFGTFVQTIVLTIMTSKTDWDQQVVLAQRRVKKWSLPESKETTTADEIMPIA